jgi:general secretion pathway protein C
LSAFVIWALVAGSIVFWGMRLFVRPIPAPSNAVTVATSVGLRGDLTRLLGAEPVAAVAEASPAANRFKLIGVMAAKTGPEGSAPGVALIAVDGKPARAFLAGARVDENWVLQTVSLRTASIGPMQGTPALVLEIPALPPPATGSLPPVDTASMQSNPPPMQAAAPQMQPAPPMPAVQGGAPPPPTSQSKGGGMGRPRAPYVKPGETAR